MCLITKARNTLWEYVILTAFPQQQWLHESPSMLHYTYIACIVYIIAVVVIQAVKIGLRKNLNFSGLKDCLFENVDIVRVK